MNDAQKIHQILTWILEGQSQHTIRESIGQHWPDDEAQPLILQAFAALTESGKITHAEIQSRCIAFTQFVYQKQIEIGEYSGALSAIKQLYALSAAREIHDGRHPQKQTKVVEHHHAVAILSKEDLEDYRRKIAVRAAQVIAVSAVSRGTAVDRSPDRKARKRSKPSKTSRRITSRESAE